MKRLVYLLLIVALIISNLYFIGYQSFTKDALDRANSTIAELNTGSEIDLRYINGINKVLMSMQKHCTPNQADWDAVSSLTLIRAEREDFIKGLKFAKPIDYETK